MIHRTALAALSLAALSLLAQPALAGNCTGVSVGNASTDDVKLGGADADRCVVSAQNPQQFGGNASGFSGEFTGNAWSVLAGFDQSGVQTLGTGALGGTSFVVSFTKDASNKAGSWSITADKTVTLDLVFAEHGANRSGNFFFDNEALVKNAASTGTWTLEWHNNGGSVPNYSNLVVFARDVTVSAVPEPETYTLMLAGLVAVAFVARRRA